MGKTKILCSSHKDSKPVNKGNFPCGVCSKGVVRKSILCCGCQHWVHKCCSDMKGKLKPDPEFKGKKCVGGSTSFCSRTRISVV